MMLNTLRVSDDLTDSARQYKASIEDTVRAMECALAGKPHPRINTLTNEQKRWKWLAHHTADRPPTKEQHEKERSIHAQGIDFNNGSFGENRGYGQGRRMGD